MATENKTEYVAVRLNLATKVAAVRLARLDGRKVSDWIRLLIERAVSGDDS